MPDGPEWQEQDQSIRQDVDRARDDQVQICVDADAWHRRVPRFAHGGALKDNR